MEGISQIKTATMNIHTLAPRPRLLVTRSSSEFDRVIERARAGEFKIETLTSMRTRTGQDNAVWRFSVRVDNADFRRGEPDVKQPAGESPSPARNG